MRKVLGILSAGALGASALAIPADDFYTKPAWYIGLFGGRSARILGSQDMRNNYGISIAWARPERKFKWRYGPAKLVMEGYYEHSAGTPALGRDERAQEAFGFIGYARFHFVRREYSFYLDIGEGIQIANVESYDLNTKINSSPMIGVGVGIRQGSQETLVGVRILHLSNAGIRPPNRGQNQVQFTVSVRF